MAWRRLVACYDKARIVASTTSPSPSNKFRRYRQSYRAKGMKLLRVWVPDVTAAGFAQEAVRQAALLRVLPRRPRRSHSSKRSLTETIGREARQPGDRCDAG